MPPYGLLILHEFAEIFSIINGCKTQVLINLYLNYRFGFYLLDIEVRLNNFENEKYNNLNPKFA